MFLAEITRRLADGVLVVSLCDATRSRVRAETPWRSRVAFRAPSAEAVLDEALAFITRHHLAEDGAPVIDAGDVETWPDAMRAFAGHGDLAQG